MGAGTEQGRVGRGKAPSSQRVGLGAVVILLGAGGLGLAAPAPAAARAPVSLLYAGWFGNTIPTPAFIRTNQTFLESQPFQGLVAYLRDDASGVNATTGVMSGN